MKRKAIRILAMLLTALLVLSACGGNNNTQQPADNSNANTNTPSTPSDSTPTPEPPAPSNGGEPIKDLITWESTGTRELEGFFILNTEKAADLNVLCNAYSPLLEIDNYGKLNPAVAKEWNTPDGGKTWTFKLRDDVTWVDVDGNFKANCNAQDWVTAMEWILNYEKNQSNNTSMLIAMVEGAGDYYNYTKNLAETTPGAAKELKADASNAEFQKVGIKAPDDYTLEYTCINQCPYFDTLCTSAALYAVSQAEIDEKGVDGMIGMNNTTMWYNGPYTITEYIQNNEKILTKNESYWDKSCSLFDTVTIVMIDDGTKDDELFMTGEVDNTELNEATLKTILDNPADENNNNLVETRFRKYSYQMQLNFAKNNPDGTLDTNWNTAVANEAFRKALYYGIDLTTTWARMNSVNPLNLENLCFTMQGLKYFSDGTEYTQRVIEKLENIAPAGGNAPRRFNADLALQYKEQAMKELEGKVTFPVKIDYYIKAGGGTGLDAATVLKENFERTLGKDFVELNICEYVTSLTTEVINPRLQSWNGSGWGADYGDIENFLGQVIYGDDSAYYAMKYTNINDMTDPDTIALFQEFTALVREAQAIYDDMDARLEKFAEAEAFLLNHALSIPYNYENAWQLTKINDYSKMYALYGCQTYTYKNWETSTVPYTAEDYARFIEEYNANS